MDQHEVTRVVHEVQALAEARYVYPGIGAQVAQVLATGLAEGRYPAGERELAEAVTADLQSVNGDKHLRLLYHDQPIGPVNPGTTRKSTPPWPGGRSRPAAAPPACSAWRATSATWTCSPSCSPPSSAAS